MIDKEKAVAGIIVEIERDGENETGVIVSEKPNANHLVKIQLVSGLIVVRHIDRISQAT
jgi:hypothetical protein